MDIPDGEDYWNTSINKAFSFDDNDELTATPESFGQNRLIADDNLSEISFELPSDEIPLNVLISEEDLRKVMAEQSLDDDNVRKPMNPDDELRMLRRKIQDTIYPPSPEITANRLLMGKNCSLEAYKSLHDKKQLLDEVIRSGNGDGILKIVIFLTKTLNRKQLNRIFLTRPEACDHYLNYLIVRMKIAEATDLLSMLGKDEEAAIMQFKIASNMSNNPQIKKNRLKKVFSDYFTQTSNVPIYSQIVANSINLLEWQLLEISTGSEISVDSSPIQTLYYACSKHKWKDSNSSQDPKSVHKFAKDHNISSALFEWTALNERAKAQAYVDLETLFEKSTWNLLKGKQFCINIPLEAAIQRLHALNAPPAVLNSFLSHISDPVKKLRLAKETKAIRSVIDAFVALKDRQGLEEYRLSLTEGTEERFYAENSLKNLTRKWSTDGLKLLKS